MNISPNPTFRCFPHIINLAAQAILTKVMDMNYADDVVQDYIPACGDVDVIALLQAAIRAVRGIRS